MEPSYPSTPAPAETDPTAVVGLRIGALLIDIAISAFCSGILIGLLPSPIDADDEWILAVLPYGVFLLFGALMQSLAGGTPGKLMLGLRVIDRTTGELATFVQTWNRTVLLIVDGLFLGMVGLVTALTSKGHRRVGDMVAKTLVIRESAVGSPLHIPGLELPAHLDASAAQAGDPDAVGYVPQWDAARNAYVFWDAAAQRWLQFDDTTDQWTPM